MLGPPDNSGIGGRRSGLAGPMVGSGFPNVAIRPSATGGLVLQAPGLIDGSQVADHTGREPDSEKIERFTNLLNKEIATLETWALANQREERRDAKRFWALKIPAIVASASSGLLALLGSPWLTAAASAVAGLCVLLDGLIRGGSLRKVHLTAVYDIRSLEHDIHGKWARGLLGDQDTDRLAGKVLEAVRKERQRIEEYLKRAETE